MRAEPPRRLRVEVGATPQPGPLRAAIAARLAGRTFPSGPEDAVGRAVAEAACSARRESRSARREERPWR